MLPGPTKGVARPGITSVGPAFTPYQPPPLPTGTYDPALDAQRDASTRGLLDTTQDTTLAGTRAAEDYGIGLSDIQAQQGAIDSQYAQNVASLTRNYARTAAAQGDRNNAYGVLPGGGAALQSAAKRAANQATDQATLDTDRAQQLAPTYRAIEGLGVGYDRGVTDRTLSLSRAGREDRAFGLDIGSEKAFQAGQAGYTAPGRGEPGGMPSNEFVNGDGVSHRVVRRNGVDYLYDASGTLISKRKAK